MLVEFTFSSWYKPGDHLEELSRIVGEEIQLDDDGTIKGWNTYRGDLRKILQITNKIEIKQEESSWIYALIEKIENMEQKISEFSRDQQFNERCSVHVPGFSLMEVREVKHENYYCTDSLAEDLAEGWRILAICPQPDQRRPDYILGRW
jgi:hypothetical protein